MAVAKHLAPLTDVELRVKTLESLLTEKGLVNTETLDAIIEHYETKVVYFSTRSAANNSDCTTCCDRSAILHHARYVAFKKL